MKSADFNSRQNTRLTRDSKAVVRLQELFAAGKIDHSTEPKATWLSDSVFTAHKLANFRTCFNNMKKDSSLGGNTEEGKLDQSKSVLNFLFYVTTITNFLDFNLNRRQTDEVGPSPLKNPSFHPRP